MKGRYTILLMCATTEEVESKVAPQYLILILWTVNADFISNTIKINFIEFKVKVPTLNSHHLLTEFSLC